MSADNTPEIGNSSIEGTPNPSTDRNPTSNAPTNTETFNAMMRRSSSRLRGGSVPPPDSDVITPSPMAVIQRGGGRGRGRRAARGPTRADANTPSTPVVTLTVPSSNELTGNTNTTVTPGANLSVPSTQTNTSTNAVTQGGVGTSVIHSPARTPIGDGLVARDEVSGRPLRKLNLLHQVHQRVLPRNAMPH